MVGTLLPEQQRERRSDGGRWGGKLTCSFLNGVQFGALNAELKWVAMWSLIGNWKVCVASFQENRDEKHE